MTLIRCASHRARLKLNQLLSPSAVESFFSWDTACTGGFVAVPDERLPQALAITGCSRASKRFTYYRCWS